jgi:hypothetical protein
MSWTRILFICGIVLAITAAAPASATDVKAPTFKKNSTRSTLGAPQFHALAEIPESEPNNDASHAQAVDCGNSLRPAALLNVAAVPDSDWIRFTANAGDLITFETAPDTDPYTDTIISLIADDGVTSLISDDDNGTPPFFSKITEFAVPYTGVYYGRIRGFNAAEGAYRADLTCTPAPAPPSNDRCDGAIAIPYGLIHLTGTTRFATNDYDLCPGVPECASSCTGFNSPGKDVVFRLDIGSAGDALDLTYVLDPAATDASLYIVTDCGDPQGSCVLGQDSGDATPPEHLNYRFPAPGTYYLILDAFTSGGAAWILDGCINCATATRPATWGRLKTLYR